MSYRQIIMQWVRDTLPLGTKMTMTAEHVRALETALLEDRAKEPFSDALANLCTREMLAARADPDRAAEMVERLAHVLAFTISIVAGGDAGRAQELMMAVEGYLYDTASGMAPVVDATREATP